MREGLPEQREPEHELETPDEDGVFESDKVVDDELDEEFADLAAYSEMKETERDARRDRWNALSPEERHSIRAINRQRKAMPFGVWLALFLYPPFFFVLGVLYYFTGGWLFGIGAAVMLIAWVRAMMMFFKYKA